MLFYYDIYIRLFPTALLSLLILSLSNPWFAVQEGKENMDNNKLYISMSSNIAPMGNGTAEEDLGLEGKYVLIGSLHIEIRRL